MEGNDAAAIAILGFCYEWGRGVDQDLAEAVSLYNKSAQKKNVWGLSNLARLYEEGKGVEKNPAKAKELYAQVEDCDDPDLLCMLAESYGTGKSVCRNLDFKYHLLSVVALKTANNWPECHMHLADNLKVEVELLLASTNLPEVEDAYVPVELQMLMARTCIATYHMMKFSNTNNNTVNNNITNNNNNDNMVIDTN